MPDNAVFGRIPQPLFTIFRKAKLSGTDFDSIENKSAMYYTIKDRG
jgi:hypothetical protein